MLRSKKLKKINTINHGFFNSLGGYSSGIYKSLNCGMGSKDNKKYVKKNLKYVAKKIGVKKIVLLHQVHGEKIEQICVSTAQPLESSTTGTDGELLWCDYCEKSIPSDRQFSHCVTSQIL